MTPDALFKEQCLLVSVAVLVLHASPLKGSTGMRPSACWKNSSHVGSWNKVPRVRNMRATCEYFWTHGRRSTAKVMYLALPEAVYFPISIVVWSTDFVSPPLVKWTGRHTSLICCSLFFSKGWQQSTDICTVLRSALNSGRKSLYLSPSMQNSRTCKYVLFKFAIKSKPSRKVSITGQG